MTFQKVRTNSNYQWLNLDYNGNRVGKVRCSIYQDKTIIYSIFICEEYRNRGYARKFIEHLKEERKQIIADRVKYNAIGFWEKMEFIPDNKGNYFFANM